MGRCHSALSVLNRYFGVSSFMQLMSIWVADWYYVQQKISTALFLGVLLKSEVGNNPFDLFISFCMLFIVSGLCVGYPPPFHSKSIKRSKAPCARPKIEFNLFSKSISKLLTCFNYMVRFKQHF